MILDSLSIKQVIEIVAQPNKNMLNETIVQDIYSYNITHLVINLWSLLNNAIVLIKPPHYLPSLSPHRRAQLAATKASVETTFDSVPDSSRASVTSNSTSRSASGAKTPDSPPVRPPKPSSRKNLKSNSTSVDDSETDRYWLLAYWLMVF